MSTCRACQGQASANAAKLRAELDERRLKEVEAEARLRAEMDARAAEEEQRRRDAEDRIRAELDKRRREEEQRRVDEQDQRAKQEMELVRLIQTVQASVGALAAPSGDPGPAAGGACGGEWNGHQGLQCVAHGGDPGEVPGVSALARGVGC